MTRPHPTRPAIIRFGSEVKFIDQDSHWYTRSMKEAIRIRLDPNNINRDNGIEIPEVWMPTFKKHSRRMVQQRTPGGPTSYRNIASLANSHPPSYAKQEFMR